MDFLANFIVLLVLFAIALFSFKKWRASDGQWGKIRKHGGTKDTLDSYRLIAMGMFFISAYNFISLVISLIFQIQNIIVIDAALDILIFIALYIVSKKAIKKHVARGRDPDVMQKIIGGVFLGFISAEFWVKNYAPEVIVKILNKLI